MESHPNVIKCVGKYNILKQIGKGAHGVVYLATHVDSNRCFAIKQQYREKIDKIPKQKEMFHNEVEVLQKLDHPNLLKFYELLKTDSSYYLVLQYCGQGDMEEYIKKKYPRGIVPEEAAVKYLGQIMDGFQELTSKEIMHRDFKLANIFLDDDRVVIGDFGFAKAGFQENMTMLGTPMTMAPELLNAGNNCRYTNKVDLWSVGVVYYKMLFGQYPWPGQTCQELRSNIRKNNGTSLPLGSSLVPKISSLSKDFLRRVLTEDDAKRMTWEEAFMHPLVRDLLSKEQPQVRPSLPLPQVTPAVKIPDSPGIARPTTNKLELPVLIGSPEAHRKQTSEWLLEVGLELRHTGLKYVAAFDNTIAARIALVGDALRLLGVSLWMNVFEEALEMAATGNHQNQEAAEWLLRKMRRDEPLYKNMKSHLQSKLQEEIPDDANAREVSRLSASPTTTIDELQKQLKLQTYWLLDFFSTSKSKFNPELKKELAIGIVHLYLSTHFDSSLPYKAHDGATFDWAKFKLQIYEDEAVIQHAMAQILESE